MWWLSYIFVPLSMCFVTGLGLGLTYRWRDSSRLIQMEAALATGSGVVAPSDVARADMATGSDGSATVPGEAARFADHRSATDSAELPVIDAAGSSPHVSVGSANVTADVPSERVDKAVAEVDAWAEAVATTAQIPANELMMSVMAGPPEEPAYPPQAEPGSEPDVDLGAAIEDVPSVDFDSVAWPTYSSASAAGNDEAMASTDTEGLPDSMQTEPVGTVSAGSVPPGSAAASSEATAGDPILSLADPTLPMADAVLPTREAMAHSDEVKLLNQRLRSLHDALENRDAQIVSLRRAMAEVEEDTDNPMAPRTFFGGATG